MYDDLFYEIKTNTDDFWEYIEKNIDKYSTEQFFFLSQELLKAIWNKTIINNSDEFTWNLIVESFLLYLKKNTDINKGIVSSLNEHFEEELTVECVRNQLLYILQCNYTKWQAMSLFEYLSLSVICNCTKKEIQEIFSSMNSVINISEENYERS